MLTKARTARVRIAIGFYQYDPADGANSGQLHEVPGRSVASTLRAFESLAAHIQVMYVMTRIIGDETS